MSASLNKVFLIGYVGRDIELKYGQSGNAVANISLATDESYMDRNGEKVKRAEWHRLVAYGKTAETCSNYLRKGSLVYIEGSLQTRKWQDQTGEDRYTTEIKVSRVQFLDRKEPDKDNGANQNASRQVARNDAPEFDDVPF